MTENHKPDPIDPFDRLTAELRAAAPAPDAARKAATLARAQEIFDAAQGSRAGARLTSESAPEVGGLAAGVKRMIATARTSLFSRKALLATTSLATAAIALMVVVPLDTRQTAPLQRTEAESTGLAQDSAADMALPAPAPMAEIAAEPPMALTRNAAPAAKIAPEGFIAPMPGDAIVLPEADTEAFANADPNPVKVTAEDPVSTFSVDVDTASWGIVRSSIMAGQLPPKDAVRVEEMVNYFPYAYPAPEPGGAPFRPTVSVTQTPWNPGTRLVQIALQGEMPALADRPPLNLVFLVDTSGSMQDPDKLPLLIQSFRLMLGELRPEDEVAIVTYAGSAGLALPPTPASERAAILAALDGLFAGGSTAGQAGLQQAYAVANQMAAEGEVSRVILATDGDFNVGLSDPQALEDFIAGKRASGTYLSVLGFGRGNLDDATMQALAQTGNGRAAYIDTLNEARKVLVDELSGALYPIADDVKIQVEFNPAAVAEYRLIGYETRALAREDFANDAVDAGEIGAGHQVTALYEVTPVGSPAVLNAPLRYGTAAPATGETDELGFLRLRYKQPGEQTSRLLEQPIPNAVTEAGDDQRFAAAIAGFGQLLRGDSHVQWSYAQAAEMAEAARGADRFGYRTEAASLMRLAAALENSDR